MKITYTILLTALIVFAASAQTEPVDTDGNGFRNISTLDHLRWLSFSSDYMDENYELDNDINAADTRNWNDGEGFYQISDFTGKFNGNGYEIDSLYISRIDRSRIGFFSSASSAEIKNLGITNCDIQGENYVGALLADDFSSCTITNCYSTGNVKGTSNVGGLVGDSQNSTISNCYSNSNVNGEESVGGLVGSDISTVFMNSYSTGNVIGSSFYVGGLVGETGAYTKIKNCYSTGNVNGDSYVGGLAGWIEHSTIVSSYSTGNVSGNDALGGLVGYDYTSYMYSTVKSSFWDIETSGQSESAAGIGKSTKEMKTIKTFTDAGWNFDAVWSINLGYPYINDRTIPEPEGLKPFDTDYNGYRNITQLAHIVWISNNASSWSWNYELDNDINAFPTRYWNEGDGFSPIGKHYTRFKGKFKGNGYKIDSLYISRMLKSDIGFLGNTSEAEIKNIGITNCDISGNYDVSGLVGEIDKSTIRNCYSSVNVNGFKDSGGLAGIINECTISNCYSTGKVSDGQNVGGLVGQKTSSNVSNSFWDIETSGLDTSDGGTGKSTQEMKTKSTFTNAGWDFDSTWSINKDINEGYPYLLPDSVNTSVANHSKIEHNVKLYPNPVYNSFSINSDEKIISVEVFDPEGKLVQSFEKDMTSYNISGLSSGFYFVKVNYRKKYQLVKILKD